MATPNQLRFPLAFGLLAGTSVTSSTLGLNTTGTWLAFSFTPDQAKTLNSVRVNLSSITGTLAANDITCEIQTDANNAPSGSAVTGGSAQPCNAVPVVGYIQFDGFTASLSASTQYWLVLKNPNTTGGNAAANFPVYKFTAVVTPITFAPAIAVGNTSSTYSQSKLQSANSGTSWTTTLNAIGAWQLNYSDGTYEGFPLVTNTSSPTDAKCFNTGTASNEAGIKFVWAANGSGNLKAVTAALNNSAGVGPFKYRLYEGASTSACTLVAESETFTAGEANAAQVLGHFAAAYALKPGMTYRLTIADTSATGSTTKYVTPQEVTVDGSCPAALLPLDGTLVKTTTSNGASAVGNAPGTAFADAGTGVLPIMGMFLDTNAEFSPAAAGVINRVTNLFVTEDELGAFHHAP